MRFALCVCLACSTWSDRSEGAIEFSPLVKPTDVTSSSGALSRGSGRRGSAPVVGGFSTGNLRQANLGRGRRRLSRSSSNNLAAGQIGGGGGSTVTSSTPSGLVGQFASVIDPQEQQGGDGDVGSGGDLFGDDGNGTDGNGATTPEPSAIVLWSALIGAGCMASRAITKRSA